MSEASRPSHLIRREDVPAWLADSAVKQFTRHWTSPESTRRILTEEGVRIERTEADATWVFVLGHGSCGAVKAAVDVVVGGMPISPTIDVIVNAIRSSVEAARRPGDLIANAIREYVRTGIRRL